MSLYLIIFLFIVFFSLKDFHRAVLIYAPLRMFLHSGICLRYESPIISLDFACCTIFFIFFLYKKKDLSKFAGILGAYIFLIIAYVIAIFTSAFTIAQSSPSMIGKIVLLVYSLIFLSELKDRSSTNLFNVAYTIMMVVMVAFGLMEYIIQENPVITYEQAMFPEDLKNLIYQTSIRMDSIRCQSFTAISIVYGTYCALWIGMAILCQKQYKTLFNVYFVYIFVALCAIGMFSSGSKSPFIFIVTFFGLYLLVAKGNKSIKIGIVTLVISLFVFFQEFLFDFYIQIVDSSNSSTAGSDIPMRLMQVKAVEGLLDEHSWLFGLGAKGVMNAQKLNPSVLGAESIWLQIILEQGLLGCAAYLYMMTQICRYAKNILGKLKSNNIKIFILSWIALNTVTSLPGLDITFILCLCFSYIEHERHLSLTQIS